MSTEGNEGGIRKERQASDNKSSSGKALTFFGGQSAPMEQKAAAPQGAAGKHPNKHHIYKNEHKGGSNEKPCESLTDNIQANQKEISKGPKDEYDKKFTSTRNEISGEDTQQSIEERVRFQHDKVDSESANQQYICPLSDSELVFSHPKQAVHSNSEDAHQEQGKVIREESKDTQVKNGQLEHIPNEPFQGLQGEVNDNKLEDAYKAVYLGVEGKLEEEQQCQLGYCQLEYIISDDHKKIQEPLKGNRTKQSVATFLEGVHQDDHESIREEFQDMFHMTSEEIDSTDLNPKHRQDIQKELKLHPPNQIRNSYAENDHDEDQQNIKEPIGEHHVKAEASGLESITHKTLHDVQGEITHLEKQTEDGHSEEFPLSVRRELKDEQDKSENQLENVQREYCTNSQVELKDEHREQLGIRRLDDARKSCEQNTQETLTYQQEKLPVESDLPAIKAKDIDGHRNQPKDGQLGPYQTRCGKGRYQHEGQGAQTSVILAEDVHNKSNLNGRRRRDSVHGRQSKQENLEDIVDRRSDSPSSLTTKTENVEPRGPSASKNHTHRSNTTSSRNDLVEMSTVRPMFEDSARKRSYHVSAEMRALVSKHLLSSVEDIRDNPLLGSQLIILLFLLLIGALVILFFVLSARKTLTVFTPVGTFNPVKISFEGRYVYRVLQIRFGEDTSFGGRFRQSAPPKSSTDAQSWRREPCPQGPQRTAMHARLHQVNHFEDCLHLDLWTPSLNSETALRTVLLFIHGRNFKWGWSAEYNALALSALGELVVVVPNYRLHVLGFLGDGTDDTPGNLALYDQLLALNWTMKYVRYFGGNSSSIVVLGYEAGARSLGLHLLSPVRNAFHDVARFILQSGSPFMPFKANSKLKDVFGTLKCDSHSLENSWQCLRSLPTQAFTSAPAYENLVMGPSFASEYLPFRPNILSQRTTVVNKEVLLGNVLDEGGFQLELNRRKLGKKRKATAFTKEELERFGVAGFDTLRRLYINDSSWESGLGDAAARVLKILGDVLYTCPMMYLADYLSDQRNQVFSYVFSHKPSFGPFEDTSFGPMLYDDLNYLFGGPLADPMRASPIDQEISHQVIDLVSTFAKSGRLPPVRGFPWPRHSKKSRLVVDIGRPPMGLMTDYWGRCDSIRNFIWESFA